MDHQYSDCAGSNSTEAHLTKSCSINHIIQWEILKIISPYWAENFFYRVSVPELVFYWLSGGIWQYQLLTCLLRDSKILFCFLFLIVSSLLSQVDMSDFLDMVIRDYLNYSKFVCVILFLVPSLSSSISSSSFNCESRVFLFVVPGCIYTFLVSIFF